MAAPPEFVERYRLLVERREPQPGAAMREAAAVVAAALEVLRSAGVPDKDVRTAAVSNSRVDVEEQAGTGFVAATNNTVADLVHALTRIKTNTRDIISILRAVKAAGALHAELVVQ